jgi:hypothetical protein
MINYNEQEMHTALLNGTQSQLSQSDLSSFLISCQIIGVGPDNFGIMIQTIADYVIDGTDDHETARELKRILLFLRMLETFLNGLKIN